MRLNDVSDALEAAEQALEIAEPRNLVRIVADAMNNKAATLSNHGRRRESVALQKEAVAMAVEGGWTDLELRLRNNLAVSIEDDDRAGASRIYREIFDIAKRIGSVQWFVVAASAIADGDYLEGRDWDAALEVAADARGRTPKGSYGWMRLATAELMIRAARGEDTGELGAEIASVPIDDTQQWSVDMALADAAWSAGHDAESASLARASLASGMTRRTTRSSGRVWPPRCSARNGHRRRAPPPTSSVTGCSRAGYRRRSRPSWTAGPWRSRASQPRRVCGSSRASTSSAAWSSSSTPRAGSSPPSRCFPMRRRRQRGQREAREVFERLGARPYLERLNAVAIGAATVGTRASEKADAEVATEPS